MNISMAYTVISLTLLAGLTMASCGGAVQGPTPGATEATSSPPASSDSKEADALAVPSEPAKPYAVRIDEAEASKLPGSDVAKLLELSALSPKTHAAVVKGYLWKSVAECEGMTLVAVEPMPGVLIAKGESPKVRAEVAARLKEAGALAKQRGTAIEVVSGYQTTAEAVKTWNHAVLEAAVGVAKSVSAAERKEKNLMSAVRKRLDAEADPKEWTESACKSGRLSGLAVVVQLVGLDASGGRGAVMVKGGPEGDRFDKDSYEATYWDKVKGKNYRMLTEIMTAGSFVRQCSTAFRFTFAPDQQGSWRCKEGLESWEPSNRPIPAWQ